MTLREELSLIGPRDEGERVLKKKIERYELVICLEKVVKKEKLKAQGG